MLRGEGGVGDWEGRATLPHTGRNRRPPGALPEETPPPPRTPIGMKLFCGVEPKKEKQTI